MDKKEKKRISAQKYYQKNKEKILEKVKKYNKENTNKKKEYDKKNYIEKKETINKKQKEYWCKNKDILNKKQRERKLTEPIFNGRFKHINLLEGDFDRYINSTNCEICNIKYTKKINDKCLDHNHHSNYLRFICCKKCNIKLGVVDRIKNNLHLDLYRYIIYNDKSW